MNPRLGALIALAFTAPLAAVTALTPAQAASETRSTPSDLSVVRVHTWAESSAHAATPPKPVGTWIDGIHGPVLDGALLSTPTFVALLLGLAVVAVIMAGRAGHDTGGRTGSRTGRDTGSRTGRGRGGRAPGALLTSGGGLPAAHTQVRTAGSASGIGHHDDVLDSTREGR